MDDNPATFESVKVGSDQPSSDPDPHIVEIKAGLAEAERGQFATEDELANMLRRYGVSNVGS